MSPFCQTTADPEFYLTVGIERNWCLPRGWFESAEFAILLRLFFRLLGSHFVAERLRATVKAFLAEKYLPFKGRSYFT